MDTKVRNRKKINLDQRIDKIHTLCGKANYALSDLILLLADTHVNTCWSRTKYGTFKAFLKEHVHGLSHVTSAKYVYACVRFQHLGYNSTEIKTMYHACTPSRLGIAAWMIKKKIDVNTVIKQVQAGKYRNPQKQLVKGEQIWRFSLPKETSDKLTKILVAHGMIISGDKHRKTRDAFIAWLNPK